MLATLLPGILTAPLAGALVDRWDCRRVMIASDTRAALSTLAIWALLTTARLEIWHIYAANVISSILSSFQQPVHQAPITLLVPREHLGRHPAEN